MTQRFFIPAHWLTPPTVTLHGETARQIQTVLRLRPGDEIIVLDNSGLEWQVRLVEISKDEIQGQLVTQRLAQGEPSLPLTLYQGTLKAQKFEWVLQKGTEVGVSRFVPIICQRSIVSKADDLSHKQARWQRIIREAAEQSRRGRLPRLEPAMSLEAALKEVTAQPASLLVMPWEEATGPTLKTALSGVKPQAAGVFIGPEGGFTPHEAALAREAGVQLVTLGVRILRAETAALAVCAVILYELDLLLASAC
ncbi:MAG: 16S rRNA (uracil(1498)-N(3))-methyltransferase [Chloroflexi bacterium]|nr:16S rRNA (uracil(1498)-N(3))-methyltransferase [Chloroflexota bacterium]